MCHRVPGFYFFNICIPLSSRWRGFSRRAVAVNSEERVWYQMGAGAPVAGRALQVPEQLLLWSPKKEKDAFVTCCSKKKNPRHHSSLGLSAWKGWIRMRESLVGHIGIWSWWGGWVSSVWVVWQKGRWPLVSADCQDVGKTAPRELPVAWPPQKAETGATLLGDNVCVMGRQGRNAPGDIIPHWWDLHWQRRPAAWSAVFEELFEELGRMWTVLCELGQKWVVREGSRSVQSCRVTGRVTQGRLWNASGHFSISRLKVNEAAFPWGRCGDHWQYKGRTGTWGPAWHP